jgi:ATP-binding cassette, subfamily B, bacterial PglK
MKNFKKLLFFLSPRELKQGVLLLIMIIIMAFLEMIGVASIMPFIAVLTNPNIVETNSILSTMFQFSSILGVSNNREFLFFLGILVFVLLVFSLLFKALTTYLQIRFVQMREYTIGKQLIENYLCHPYDWFLNQNTSDLGKKILSEVSVIIGSGMRPMIEIISKSIVTFAIIFLLALTNLNLTVAVGLTFFIIYVLIYFFSRGFLKRIGKERLQANQLRFYTITEAFSAIKEIKLGGLENIYTKRFSKPAKNYALHNSSSQILAQLPRFGIEIIAFGGMLLVILYLMAETGKFAEALPIVAVFGFAGYRLMPALQQIYHSMNQIRFIGPAIDELYKDFKDSETYINNKNQEIDTFEKTLTLNNICYEYPNSSNKILKDINLIIQARSTVGFVGKTGSGKTTIIDIILGLLDLKKGSLKIDGIELNKNNIRSWQKSIGYVPQNIYLSDDTIAANIAFGVEEKNYDQQRIENAAKTANLHEFVTKSLPKKYQTNVGERGVRLSGGQRQRIGIARALYKNPKLLVMDEATNSLDNQTEKAVMEAVHKLNKEITIILIAHRLNTLSECEKIYLLKDGKITNQGKFKDIIKDVN